MKDKGKWKERYEGLRKSSRSWQLYPHPFSARCLPSHYFSFSLIISHYHFFSHLSPLLFSRLLSTLLSSQLLFSLSPLLSFHDPLSYPLILLLPRVSLESSIAMMRAWNLPTPLRIISTHTLADI
jgi:hypothetical protein